MRPTAGIVTRAQPQARRHHDSQRRMAESYSRVMVMAGAHS